MAPRARSACGTHGVPRIDAGSKVRVSKPYEEAMDDKIRYPLWRKGISTAADGGCATRSPLSCHTIAETMLKVCVCGQIITISGSNSEGFGPQLDIQ